jgi:hypothetical protein
MRDSVLVLGLVLVAVAGADLALRSRAEPLRSPLYNVSAASEPAPSKSAPSKPAHSPSAAKPKATVPSLPHEPVADAPVVSEAAPAPPPTTPIVVTAPPSFPTADRIAAGLLKDTVTTAYGGPAISAVTSADGHMVETMVYAQKGGRSETVIRLEEGKVSSSYTKMTVAPAPGVLVPRPRIQP